MVCAENLWGLRNSCGKVQVGKSIGATCSQNSVILFSRERTLCFLQQRSLLLVEFGFKLGLDAGYFIGQIVQD